MATMPSSPRRVSNSSASEKLNVRLLGKSTEVPGVSPVSGRTFTSRRPNGRGMVVSAMSLLALLLVEQGSRVLEAGGFLELQCGSIEVVEDDYPVASATAIAVAL